jgi:hypothetical protein
MAQGGFDFDDMDHLGGRWTFSTVIFIILIGDRCSAQKNPLSISFPLNNKKRGVD